MFTEESPKKGIRLLPYHHQQIIPKNIILFLNTLLVQPWKNESGGRQAGTGWGHNTTPQGAVEDGFICTLAQWLQQCYCPRKTKQKTLLLWPLEVSQGKMFRGKRKEKKNLLVKCLEKQWFTIVKQTSTGQTGFNWSNRFQLAKQVSTGQTSFN